MPQPIGKNYEFTMPSGEKATVGDSTSPTFKPALELFRWGEERKLKVAFPTVQAIDSSLSADKVVWDSPALVIRFYDTKIDGFDAFEFEVILKAMLAINSITLTVESDGLNWYYQPPLTEQFTSGWNEEFQRNLTVTETEVRDTDTDELLVFCPENVVGSYSIRHDSKSGDYTKLGGKNYRSGKFGHVYRPKATDNNGKSIWGSLNYSSGQLTITFDNAWLKSAKYPVVIDPTFGCDPEAPPALLTTLYTDRLGGVIGNPGEAAVADSISMYGKTSQGASIKGVLVEATGLTIIDNGVTPGQALDTTVTWYTAAYSTKPTLSNQNYYACVIPSANAGLYYESGGAGRIADISNSYDSPTDPTDGTEDTSYWYGIYCTWTAAGGLSIPVAMHHYKQMWRN